jgi:hypothetical protein
MKREKKYYLHVRARARVCALVYTRIRVGVYTRIYNSKLSTFGFWLQVCRVQGEQSQECASKQGQMHVIMRRKNRANGVKWWVISVLQKSTVAIGSKSTCV